MATIERGSTMLLHAAKELLKQYGLTETTKTIHIQFSLEYDAEKNTSENRAFIVRNMEMNDSICGAASSLAATVVDFEKALKAFVG